MNQVKPPNSKSSMDKSQLERVLNAHEVAGPHKPTLSQLKLKQVVQMDEASIQADQTIMLTADEAPSALLFRRSATATLEHDAQNAADA